MWSDDGGESVRTFPPPRAPHIPHLSPTTIITSYEEQVELAGQVVAALWIAVEEQTDVHIWYVYSVSFF